MALTEQQIENETIRRKEIFAQYQGSSDYQEKLVQRLKLNDAGQRSVEARTYIWHLCARPDNPVEGAKFFINNFAWTFDPRPEHAPHHLPFITFEFQDRAIEWFIDRVDNGRDGLVEKSRDMGMSWLLFVWMPIWYWLFRDGTNILIGSYKEALVDNRTGDSLFGKIDYSLESLPKWLMPNRFNSDKHRTKMRLTNPVNGNVITGDTMNPNFGRGSRKTAVLFDELGFWDYAQDAWSACGDSTSCRIANSTPNGYNFFAGLKEDGIGTLSLLWSLNPLKDDGWYAFESQRRTAEEMAQEIDLSYQKSRDGVVYAEWNNENYLSRGYYPYMEDRPLYIGWDFGKSDDTAIIWSQKDDAGRLRIVDTYRNTGRNIDFYIPFISGIISSGGDSKYHYTPDELDIINEHREWRKATHFGDPAGRFRNQVSDETVFSVLKDHGIVMNFKDRWKEFKVRKSSTKRLIMDGINLNENTRTKYFDKCILSASYPSVRTEGMVQIRSEAPKHDWTCISAGQRIRTANGWFKIEDLVGQTPIVWGSKNGRLVPTRATKVWKTHDNAKLVEVKTQFRSVRCTPEHRFLLRDGKYKEAKDLAPGDRLVPFREHANRGYVRVLLNDGSSADEHVFIQNMFNGLVPFGWTVHHVNDDKRDNRPENLEPLSRGVHCKLTRPQRKWGSEHEYLEMVPVEFGTDSRYDNYEVVKVVDAGFGPVYDIECPETNNFVVEGLVVHNSHFRSALEYLAQGLEEGTMVRRTPVDKIRVKARDPRRVLRY